MRDGMNDFVRLARGDDVQQVEGKAFPETAAATKVVDQLAKDVRPHIDASAAVATTTVPAALLAAIDAITPVFADKKAKPPQKAEAKAALQKIADDYYPIIKVTPDRKALARHGMSLGEFQYLFQTAVGGRPVVLETRPPKVSGDLTAEQVARYRRR